MEDQPCRDGRALSTASSSSSSCRARDGGEEADALWRSRRAGGARGGPRHVPERRQAAHAEQQPSSAKDRNAVAKSAVAAYQKTAGTRRYVKAR